MPDGVNPYEPNMSSSGGDDTENNPLDTTPPEPTVIVDPAEVERAKEAATRFIAEHSDTLSLIMGVGGISIRVGDGWATNLRTGEVTVDPLFFLENDYRQEWVNYGMMHEISAHLLWIIRDPELAKRSLDWAEGGEDRHLFLNIIEDIAGNKRIHALLPEQKNVAKDAYEQKMFPESDYSDEYPRHIQFLYKIMRQEMIPGSQTTVLPEVDEAIEGLRNLNGMDVISLSTDRKLPDGKEMSRDLQFQLWLKHIYPVYLELLEMDKEDDKFKKKPTEPGGEDRGYTFGDYYDEYEQNRHPHPMSHDEMEKSIDEALNIKKNNTPEKKAEKNLLERISGKSDLDPDSLEAKKLLTAIRKYRKELLELSPAIDDVSEFFNSLLDERVTIVRRLNTPKKEGVTLNSRTLVQTVIDIKSGDEPSGPFLDYGKVERERKAEGRFDCYLVVDRSISMRGERSVQATKATIVFLEGLAAFEREIREREKVGSMQLDWDVRSCVYAFNDEFSILKPLSHDLTEKQRLDSYMGVREVNGGTADFNALNDIADKIQQEITNNPETKTRRRIVVVMTDGQSNNPNLLTPVVARLGTMGVTVVAIGIQTPIDSRLYPKSQYIQNVEDLTEALCDTIESEITK